MYRTYALIGLLAGIAVVMGYAYLNQTQIELDPQVTPIPTTPLVLNPDRPPELTSPEAKIAQLFAAPIDLGSSDASVAAMLSWVATDHPGFAVIFGTAIASDEAEMAITSLDGYYVDQPLGVSVAVDHEGGTVQRLSGTGFTRLSPWQQNCVQQSGTRQDVFGKSATELSEVGIDLVFAPVVDLAASGSALRNRACSEPEQVIATASDYITSMRAQGVEPVLKHFPGIGRLREDTHLQFAALEPVLAESKLFTTLLETFPQLSVMTSHVGVTTLDPEVPCSLNSECIAAVRENFAESLVFSDALEMAAASYRPEPQSPKPLAQVAREAVVAGNDVLIFGPKISAQELAGIHRYLVQEYQESPVFQVAVEQRLAKVLAYKQRAGFVR